MKNSRSKVDRLARSLNNLAWVLLVIFVIAEVAAIAWVQDEWDTSAPVWRYVIALTSASGFLIAAVIARVGAALVQTLARVRASLLDAILDSRVRDEDLEAEFPEIRVG